MSFIERNITYLPYKRMSPWRKLAVASWSTSEEASFYGWVDFDATGIRKTISRFQQEGNKISPTTIAAKGLAIAISAYPKVNGVIRFGRIYQRENY